MYLRSNDDRLALDMAKPAQSSKKLVLALGGRKEDAYSRHIPRRLRLGGERRREEDAGHGTEKCSTLHYSIT